MADKAANLDRRRDQLYKLVSNLTPGEVGNQRNWLVETWDEYIIIQDTNDDFQKVPYFVNGDKVELADRSTWEKVEKKEEWLPAKSNALKAIGENEHEIRVANYIVLWGDENKRDLEGIGSPTKNADGSIGEFFTPETDLESEYTKRGKLDLDWEHRRDNSKGSPGNEVIGYVDWSTAKADERGVWVERAISRASKYAKFIKDLIKAGIIGTSSEAIPEQVKKAANGKIEKWALYRDTLTVSPMEPRMITENTVQAIKALQEYMPALKSIELPQDTPKAEVKGESDSTEAANADNKQPNKSKQEKNIMAEKLSQEQLDQIGQLLADREAKAKAEAEAKAAQDELIAKAVEAEKTKWEAEQAKSQRLPGGMTFVPKFAETRVFDNVETGDLDLVASILNGNRTDMKTKPASKSLLQTLAIRYNEGKEDAEKQGRAALKAAGFGFTKSDEIMQQDLSSYGDEWVGVGYGSQLWQNIRNDAKVLAKMPQTEIPQGYETFYDPTEGADPTWYKTPEVTGIDSTMKVPAATVTSSQIGTGNKNAALAKASARVLWSGELNEDSLIQMAPELRRKFQLSGAEVLEHIIIDGDTATGATTNINDIAGTPAGTEAFLVANGLRKLALVTNTANSRSASGAFAVTDFIATAKLMGAAGVNALDQAKVSFIIDANTHWAALNLDAVKTRDVFVMPTLENGKLTSIYGYEVMVSPFMHFAQASRLANSAGKIDLDTAGNNTLGAILAVRWDQWKFGWKRRMTMETTRIANADAYEIVCHMRFGLKYRDTEASAISYNVAVA